MNARIKVLSVLTLGLAFAGAVMAGDTKDAKGAKVGEKAPAWTLKDIKGAEHKLADFSGKIVVMEWVNPQCPVCRGAHEDGRIPNMVKELKAQGVEFVGINSSFKTTAEENEAALKKYGVDYTVLLDNDGTVGHLYGARTTPHLFVIDTKGVLRYAGALDDGAPDKAGKLNYALNAVKQIKANETVSPESTKSYGCSVKYAPAAGAEGKGKDKAKN